MVAQKFKSTICSTAYPGYHVRMTNKKCIFGTVIKEHLAT